MMQQYRSNSYLFGGNAPYVEEMYEAYLDNPGSVPDNWRDYFDALQHVPAADGTASRDVAHAPVVESFAQRAKSNAFALKASEAVATFVPPAAGQYVFGADRGVNPPGMSAKVGPMTFTRGEEHPFLGRKLAEEKSFSEAMAWRIDQEIAAIILRGEALADELLSANRARLDLLANALQEEETLDGRRIDELLR